MRTKNERAAAFEEYFYAFKNICAYKNDRAALFRTYFSQYLEYLAKLLAQISSKYYDLIRAADCTTIL